MKLGIRSDEARGGRQSAFTVAEVVIALGISAMVLWGLIFGFIVSTQRAEWSAYSLAAQSLANQRLEQTRAVKWDPLKWPPDPEQLVSSTYPPKAEILDIPITGGNIIYATNYTTITDVPGTSPVKLIRVDCVWSFPNRGLFTNSIATYRAPDQ
jgi:hypothetical protein